MSKSICELKIELKSKGIKGISGLNKSGLEALLKRGKSEPKKEPSKPKPFVPAPTKGESPKVAEKTINKKITVPKMLMLTYKPKKEEPKKEVIIEPKKEVVKSKAKAKKTANEVKEEFIKIFLEGDLEFINEALHNKQVEPELDILIDDNRMKRMKELQLKFFRNKDMKEQFINEYNSIDTCEELMCKYGINSKEEYKKWILKNHPDKGGNVPDAEFKQIVKCAKKNKFCK
jgi:hypothetical protein